MTAIRADANEIIATGHVMRCIAIAECLKALGEDVVFILAEDRETKRITDHGFEYRILGSVWNRLHEEEHKLIALLNEIGADRLLVDTYAADKSYLEDLQAYLPVCYIDDFDNGAYRVSWLLNYGCFDPHEYEKKSLAEKTLAGYRFTPLRKEFRDDDILSRREETGDLINGQNDGRLDGMEINESSTAHSISGKAPLHEDFVKSIFITTGGTDRCNVTEKVLDAFFSDDTFNDFHVHVVLGTMNANRDRIISRYPDGEKVNGITVHIYSFIKDMSYFMKRCTYAVSAGGTTLLELSACGLPTVAFSFADNQAGVRDMAEHNILIDAGDARRDPEIGRTIVKHLKYLYKHPEEAYKLSQNMKKLVDGKGTLRIARALLS
ncbi:MAG: glycosyltransferase [Lachnospiraceae bacterium]|jgi:UDP-2,4-diacetamido-2,4,6-trideoxy-beta-L-altropyranose hydrolase|nr:glycosyltransferase [Lachnospiraceae bacterium]MEE3460574.1 glycosyltransferase [Lachnospiraceae bacterium]